MIIRLRGLFSCMQCNCVFQSSVELSAVKMNVVVLVLSLLWLRGTLSCQVFVQTPWERTTYVPKDSIIQLKCSADSSQYPYWEIDDVFQFGSPGVKPILNGRNIFEIEQDDPGVIVMLINSTAGNNGTSIQCIYGLGEQGGPTVLETIIAVYDSSLPLISLTKSNLSTTSTNISWSDLPQVESYNLTVTSNSYSHTFPNFIQSSYSFTAPPNAPPCEVYNFSVTATPVGATYTGDGCSVPSNTLSVVLPSPPRLATVESSIQYYLEKQYAGEVMLNISFMPASYCDGYPVTEYAVEVEGPTSETLVLTPAGNLNAINNNLLDDQIYTFRVVASNAVGNASTSYMQIYTTDIQKVTVSSLSETNTSVLVQCTFAIGSMAQGCVVELGNETWNMTRSNNCHGNQVYEAVTISYPLESYTGVFGYDTESDGTIGTLAVPGEISTDGISLEPCVSTTVGLNPTQAANIPVWIYGAIGGFVALAVLLLALILIVIINHRVKRSRTHRSDSIKNFFPSSPAMSPAGSPAGPAPESPPPPPNDHLGGKEKEEKLEGDPSPLYDLPEKFTSSCTQQQEHTYHVLENSAAHYQFDAQDFHKQANGIAVHQDTTQHSHEASIPHGSHSLTTGPPPIYQDITEFSANRGQGDGEEERYDEVGDHSSQTDSSPPPVYQEITGLTSGRVLSRPLDNMPSAGTNV